MDYATQSKETACSSTFGRRRRCTNWWRSWRGRTLPSVRCVCSCSTAFYHAAAAAVVILDVIHLLDVVLRWTQSRKATVSALVRHSWPKLHSAAIRLCRHLSAFRGGSSRKFLEGEGAADPWKVSTVERQKIQLRNRVQCLSKHNFLLTYSVFQKAEKRMKSAANYATMSLQGHHCLLIQSKLCNAISCIGGKMVWGWERLMRAFRATLESVRVPDRRHNWNNGRYCCSVSGGLHVLLKFGISFSRCYSRPLSYVCQTPY